MTRGSDRSTAWHRPFIGLAVDASCRTNYGSIKNDGYYHGRTQWKVVDIATGELILASPIYQQGTVNIGEFCAIISGLRHLHEQNDSTTPVYSDSKIAINWVYQRVTKTKMPMLYHTGPILDQMAIDLEWLIDTKPGNSVRFWRNRDWGENPADFGRK